MSSCPTMRLVASIGEDVKCHHDWMPDEYVSSAGIIDESKLPVVKEICKWWKTTRIVVLR